MFEVAGWRGRIAATCALLLLVPGPGRAQDGPPFRATLRGWEEGLWLLLLDRKGAVGGRLSDRGILRRFDERIDDKYYLDRYTAGFSLAEDYEWYAGHNGARWQGASITKHELAADGQLRARVPVGSRWAIGIRFDKADTPVAVRNAMRLAVERRLGRSVTLTAHGHLDPIKPGSDLGVGVAWRGREGLGVSVGLTVLDAPNNWVFLTLDAASQPGVDTTIEYEKQPVAARLSATVPLGEQVRVEAYGTYMRPSRFLAYRERERDEGFRQEERFGYAGTLLEWTPRETAVAGVFATTVWARTDRAPLAPGVPVAAYRLTERTSEVGAFASARLAPRWRVDGWWRYTWRPERRAIEDPGEEDVDFELRAFNAQGLVTYRARSGLTANLGLLWNRATTPRTQGEVPSAGTLDGHQSRVRYDVGWRGSSGFWFLVGSAVDFDLEGQGGPSFGGARARFALTW